MLYSNLLSYIIDTDECMTTPTLCDPSGMCENTAGSYICNCFSGFVNNLTDSTQCVGKLYGCTWAWWYLLVCNRNYDFLKLTINKEWKKVALFSLILDVDECTDFLACHQICMNTPGSFVCGCFENFTLSGDNVTCERKLLW